MPSRRVRFYLRHIQLIYHILALVADLKENDEEEEEEANAGDKEK
jgi:hypothetical protein